MIMELLFSNNDRYTDSSDFSVFCVVLSEVLLISIIDNEPLMLPETEYLFGFIL